MTDRLSSSHSSCAAARGAVPVIAGYEVGRMIGRGGMGVVYMARQEILDRPVAVKGLALRADDSPEYVSRFLREARTIARMGSHANIVQVFDVVRDVHGEFFIVMEYVEGRTLQHQLGHGFWPDLASSIHCVCNIAQALNHAHTRGVIHRDVKPENIMLGSDGSIKIMDFGIAVGFGAQGRADERYAGTPRYMSPEQLGGRATQGHVDHRTDLYSLGVVLYYLTCGAFPYAGEAVAELQHSMRECQPLDPREHNRDINGELAALIMKGIALDPAERFQSGTEMRSALRPILDVYSRTPESRGAAPVHFRMPGAETQMARGTQRVVGQMGLPRVKEPELPSLSLTGLRRYGRARPRVVLYSLLLVCVTFAMGMLLAWYGRDLSPGAEAGVRAVAATVPVQAPPAGAVAPGDGEQVGGDGRAGRSAIPPLSGAVAGEASLPGAGHEEAREVLGLAAVRQMYLEGRMPAVGAVVTRGVVTFGGGAWQPSRRQFVIQDGRAGLLIDDPGGRAGVMPAEGAVVEVAGELSVYAGMLQLRPSRPIRVVQEGEVPAPLEVRAAEMSDALQGVLVVLRGVEVHPPGALGLRRPNQMIVDDIGGRLAMYVDPDTGIGGPLLPGRYETLIGVIVRFDPVGLVLYPRRAGDIVRALAP